jgi:UDP-N-acetylmuramyl pentapeptide synthase
VHLGNFSSIEEIAQAKGELFAGMRPVATAVWNASDPRVRRLADAFAGPKVSFAIDAAADLVAREIEDDIVRGVRFRLRAGGQDREVRLATFGRHNVENALAALAVASALGDDLDGAVRAVASVRAARMRGEVLRLDQGITLVDDTYNSNPAAMASVLASVAATAWTGRKVVVMGDMLELGERAASFHRQVGEQAARAGVGLLAAAGPLAGETVAGAAALGMTGARAYPDAAAAAAEAAALIAPGDLVVVKGSRGIGMELFVAAVKAAYDAPREAGH